jgi:hypothetical protein
MKNDRAAAQTSSEGEEHAQSVLGPFAVVHTGAARWVQGALRVELHIYADVADAVARGVSPVAAHAIFHELPAAKGCETRHDVPGNGSVDCLHADAPICLGQCHVFSIDNNDPPVGPPRDEGQGPITKEWGRIYRCSCVERK